MRILKEDWIFLQDCVQFSWLQRIVSTHALARAGAGGNPRAFTKKALSLYFVDKSDKELEAMLDANEQNARVQAIAVARIFAEYAATLEDTGAFVRAIDRRKHGILKNNFDYDVGAVKQFYEHVKMIDQPTLTKLLRFPNPGRHLKRYRGSALYKEAQREHTETARRISIAATNYLKLGKERIFKLNTGHLRANHGDFIHILVNIGPKPLVGKKGVFVHTYNKIKHGFNVLELVPEYVKLPRRPERVDVVKLSMKWPSIATLIGEIEKLSVMRSRLATLVLRLDEEGILDVDPKHWPEELTPASA